MQISLSGDSIDRYFRILEQYVLPLMVVSTIVLFCGYLASRIYHRTVHRKRPGDADDLVLDDSADTSPQEGTAAFLRELRATPPIVDTEPRQEPKARSQHPFLRKRAVNAAAALRTRTPESDDAASEHREPSLGRPAPGAGIPRFELPDRLPERAPRTEAPWPEPMSRPEPARHPEPSRQERPAPVSPAAPYQAAPVAPPPAAPEVRKPAEIKGDPRLGGVSRDDAGAGAPAQPFPAPEPVLRADRPDVADRSAADRIGQTGRDAGAEDGKVEPPPVATAATWWKEPEQDDRAEPQATVVHALKASPPPAAPADVEAARVRAGEIGDSLDYAASVLQQAAALVGQRLQAKQGLTLDDVRGIRINGFDQPHGVLEDLRKLGGDVAGEVLAVYATVANYDNVLRRLEQMAASEPLDEGWNDLLRARVSDTLYAVGQVRKTLGGYRIGSRKPGKPGDAFARPGGAPGAGPDHPIPVGRRQV